MYVNCWWNCLLITFESSVNERLLQSINFLNLLQLKCLILMEKNFRFYFQGSIPSINRFCKLSGRGLGHLSPARRQTRARAPVWWWLEGLGIRPPSFRAKLCSQQPGGEDEVHVGLPVRGWRGHLHLGQDRQTHDKGGLCQSTQR